MDRRKQDTHGFVVPLLVCVVCASIASRAGATRPVGRTAELARETAPVSFGTATTSDWSVVAWVARRPDGTAGLKAAWVPWGASVAGASMALAEAVADLPPQPLARDDGSAWVIYASGDAILGRIVTPGGPMGDPPITLTVPDGFLHEFHASAQPDGGLLLWWYHQGRDDSINHQSARAFDWRGIPLADESELLGGETGSKLAVAADGGALEVARTEDSEQGILFDYLTGLHFDNDAAFLRGVQLTPRIQPPVAILQEFDVSRAASGGYWLTWREDRADGAKVRARRVAAGGDPGRILTAGADPTATPLAPTPDDGCLLCWASHGRLLAQRHGRDARPRGGAILLARGTPASQQLPLQLAVTATGRGVVAWWGPPASDESQALFLTRFAVTSRPTRGS